jgi:hypothetical protein
MVSHFSNGNLKNLPDDSVLRITKMYSGSDATFSLLGIDKVMEQLGKGLVGTRDWKEKKEQQKQKTEQERQKTEQEYEKTRQARLENLQRTMDIYDRLKNMEPKDREQILNMMRMAVAEIEDNRNKLLPK